MAKADKTEKTVTTEAQPNVVVTKLPDGTVIENAVGESK